MDHHSTLKRKEIQIQGINLTDLEDIKLSKINQSQKDEYCVIPVGEIPRVAKFIDLKIEWWLPKVGERWICWMGIEFPFSEMKSCINWMYTM